AARVARRADARRGPLGDVSERVPEQIPLSLTLLYPFAPRGSLTENTSRRSAPSSSAGDCALRARAVAADVLEDRRQQFVAREHVVVGGRWRARRGGLGGGEGGGGW